MSNEHEAQSLILGGKVTKSKIISLVLSGILLFSLLLTTGCLTGTATTNTDGSTSGGGFDWTLIVFIVVIFGLMYLLMIRPQRKRQKEQQKLMEELKRGDDVLTTSGIYGKIESVEETSFVLKLESGATMRVVKGAVAGRRPTA
jgi:preprotein translocase subunit YajC